MNLVQYEKLRSAGDFPNPAAVEYATVKVIMRHGDLPINLKNLHCHNDSEVTLYFSPNGRLTYKELQLDSKLLAEKFKTHMEGVVAKREYNVRLTVEVSTSNRTKLTTANKVKHSEAVKNVIQY